MRLRSDQAGSVERRKMAPETGTTEGAAERDEIAENWYGLDMATFGDRVAAAREAAGMSRKQMARRLGVKLGTVRGWEDDLSEPRANKLSMMAGLLNVSIVWLLTGEG